MTGESKITSYQLFSILFLIDVTIVLTYSPKLSGSKDVWDFIISTVVYFVLSFILIIPTFLLYKKYPRINLFEGKMGLVFRYIYSIYFLWLACYTVSIFKIFIKNIMSDEIPIVALTIFTIVIAIYSALKGMQAIARTSVVILFLIEISLAFIFLSLIPRIDTDNYNNFFENGVTDAVNGVVYMLSRNFPVPIVTLLLPLIDGKKKRAFTMWNIFVALLFIVVTLINVGSLGKYLETQVFPAYAVTQLTEIGVFKHMNAIYIGVFAMGIYILISTFLYLFTFVCKSIKSQKMKYRSISVGFFLFFVLGGVIPDSNSFSYFIFDKFVLLILMLITVVILPIIFFIKESVKEKRQREC